MPREDRRIIFENEEVYKALFAFNFQKQLKQLAVGQITNIAEIGPERVLIKIENPFEHTEATHEVTGDFLAAALMLFCRGCGIPLPRGSKKSVMINDGQVTLRVQI